MELTKQVVSLELSKKLKELGFEQESLFYWYRDEDILTKKEATREDLLMYCKPIPAYTVAELGEMLPEKVKTPYGNKSFLIFREVYNETWDVAYSTDTDDDKNLWQQAETEADSRAKMLIYLKENDLLTNKMYGESKNNNRGKY